MTVEELGGLVLAGGEGRRMGGPKASAPLRGTTLVERAVATLVPHCSEVIVSTHEGVPLPPLDVEVSLDERGGARSALTGLVTGLRALEAPEVLVLACDLVVTDALVARLVETAGPAAAALDEHGPQPLCARYDRARTLAVCRELIESGDLRVRQLVELLEPVLVPVEPGELINVNTRADLERADGELS